MLFAAPLTIVVAVFVFSVELMACIAQKRRPEFKNRNWEEKVFQNRPGGLIFLAIWVFPGEEVVPSTGHTQEARGQVYTRHIYHGNRASLILP